MLMTSSIAPAVSIPRMTAGDTIAIILALQTSFHAQSGAQESSEAHDTAAHGRKQPRRAPAEHVETPLTMCLSRLGAACDALSRAYTGNVGAAEGAVSDKANRAQRRGRANRCKRAWTAMQSQIAVWRETGALDRLPAASRAAFDRVLPAGSSLNLRGSGRTVWNTGDQRLARMKSEGVDDVIASLGGAGVLAHVRHAHDEFGASLGVTAPVSAPGARGGDVAPALAVAQSTLREYVLKVYATVGPDVPGSESAAAALLAPLLEAAASSASRTPKTKPAKTSSQPKVPNTRAPANDTAPTVRATGTG